MDFSISLFYAFLYSLYILKFILYIFLYIFSLYLLYFSPSLALWRCASLRNLANALRNLDRRREAVELVWSHIGSAVEAIDCSGWEETSVENQVVIATQWMLVVVVGGGWWVGAWLVLVLVLYGEFFSCLLILLILLLDVWCSQCW